jgi:hypothetical protein
MKKIAYLASRVTLPGSPIRRTDAFEHDNMMDALRSPFEARGYRVEDVAWDNPKADWSAYEAAIIGTTWDYWDRMEEFLTALERIEGQTRLFNGSALVHWNSRKTYLRQLEAKGARLIPTLWLDDCSEAAAKAAFDTLGADDVVFKRQVGAGAKDQHRVKRGEPIPAMPHAMMAQPFLPMIQTEGELSFIFIDGDHSYEACQADIVAWAPFVKRGGVIAFHDFGSRADGVTRAIFEETKAGRFAEIVGVAGTIIAFRM